MTTTNSFVPPPELVQQWLCSDDYPWGPLEQTSITITTNRLQNVATQAAQWGADQELEACCEWLREFHQGKRPGGTENLRRSRRPKPPSLKEQALEALEALPTPAGQVTADRLATIRRALEALDD